MIRWVHTFAQVADALTKKGSVAAYALQMLQKAETWKVMFDEQFISGRKRDLLQKKMLDTITPDEARKIRSATCKESIPEPEQNMQCIGHHPEFSGYFATLLVPSALQREIESSSHNAQHRAPS